MGALLSAGRERDVALEVFALERGWIARTFHGPHTHPTYQRSWESYPIKCKEDFAAIQGVPPQCQARCHPSH